MEKTCPRCKKKVVVSSEELSMRGGVAVCPQCLAFFDMDGNIVNASRQGHSRMKAGEPTLPAKDPEAYSFCPECGKPLPGGIRFCPYCGIRLSAPTEPRRDEGVAPESLKPAPVSVTPEPQPVVQPVAQPQPSQWTPVYPTYYRERKWGSEPASLRTRVVGYCIIVAQLIVLLVIVWGGFRISE